MPSRTAEVVTLQGELLTGSESKQETYISMAVNIIEFLNSKTGKKFPTRNPRGMPSTNTEPVMGRLKEGYTIQDCKSVIAAKCREWLHDDKMSKHLTPETLFRRSNFERYLGEIGGADEMS